MGLPQTTVPKTAPRRKLFVPIRAKSGGARLDSTHIKHKPDLLISILIFLIEALSLDRTDDPSRWSAKKKRYLKCFAYVLAQQVQQKVTFLLQCCKRKVINTKMNHHKSPFMKSHSSANLVVYWRSIRSKTSIN